MANYLLVLQIERAKSGDEQSVLYIVERFEPLLKKYARKLKGCDDGYSELKCELVEIILRYLTARVFVNDGAVVSYVEKALRHAYLRINRKMQSALPEILFSEVSEAQLNSIDRLTSSIDDYTDIHIEAIKDALTEKEFSVLCRHYIHGFSVSEIAIQDGIERQTVNRTKLRAINKLNKKL